MRRENNGTLANALRTGALIGAGLIVPAIAQAQARPDGWEFNAILYGYFPDIGGSTTFPAGTGSSISVSSDTILDNLKFVFMGSLEAQRGPWGAFTDVIYMDVGGSKSETRDLRIGGVQLPAGVTASAQLDIKGWLWTIAGNYRAMSTPEGNLDVFAGARLLDVEEKFGWEFSADVGPVNGPGRQGTSEADINNWDGIVGVKGRVKFGPQREWFIPYYVDVGTGESEFTWQGIAGIGYSFKSVELLAVWRYIDYEFKSGKKVESLDFNGPAVGIAFRF